MIGNFQDGSMAGRIQFGSAWWFVDQKEGIEWQLNALSNAGLLRTSSACSPTRVRSCPTHATSTSGACSATCSGAEIENGELPDDDALIGSLIEGVCYRNASEYFGWK